MWVTRGPFRRLPKTEILCDCGDMTTHTLVGGAQSQTTITAGQPATGPARTRIIETGQVRPVDLEIKKPYGTLPLGALDRRRRVGGTGLSGDHQYVRPQSGLVFSDRTTVKKGLTQGKSAGTRK